MTRSEHRKAFKEFAEETQEELGDSLKKLILYGSVARGEETRSSDIDLLVDFEKDRGLFDDYIGLKRFLKDLFDQEIDLVKRNKVREELRDSILRGDRIGAEI
jgi:predicted nucleotidyltransferase